MTFLLLLLKLKSATVTKQNPHYFQKLFHPMKLTTMCCHCGKTLNITNRLQFYFYPGQTGFWV